MINTRVRKAIFHATGEITAKLLEKALLKTDAK